MKKLEADVRNTAKAFDAALVAAKAGGLHVQWPRHREDLSALVISETAKVEAPKKS